MFDKEAIQQALGYKKFIDLLGVEYAPKARKKLNYGRGEQYGRTPVEFSFLFKVATDDGEKYFHFFTSDMRYTNGDCRACIRTAENYTDYTGGQNHFLYCIEDLRRFFTTHGVAKAQDV